MEEQEKTTEGLFLPIIDTSKMSADEIEAWKKIDEALEQKFKDFSETSKAFFGDEASPGDVMKKLKEIDKALKDIQEQKKDYVDNESFQKVKKDINDSLVRFKTATTVNKSGEREMKSVEQQVKEQLKDYITVDPKTGVEKVDLKAACKAGAGSKKTLDLVFTKAFLTTDAPYLGGITVDTTLGVSPRPKSTLREYANVSNTSTRAVVVAEMSATGEAEWVPEGELKPAMDGTINERTVTAGKVALTAKTSEEVLQDIPQLVAEIRLEISNRIDQAETNGILYGTGTNGEILGVAADIPEFSLTGIEVQRPNNFDALVAAYTQIYTASNMNFRPNVTTVNPIDYANMTLEKDANGQYLLPYRNGGELIPGLQIVPDSSMEIDNFIMGDFRYLNIRDYVGYTLTFGWENDDFTRNMVTMVGEKRLLAYIKSNHLLAFVKGEFSVIKAAIEAPDAGENSVNP